MPSPAWAPSLADVARHIPTRTRDTRTPGSDQMQGTFTAATTPNDVQAQQVIDDTLAAISAEIGVMPSNATQNLLTAARQAVEWRAAADIEIAYPNRDADVRVYDQLNARATQAFQALQTMMQIAGAGELGEFPVWLSPNPPVYADHDPGDFTPPMRNWFATGGGQIFG